MSHRPTCELFQIFPYVNGNFRREDAQSLFKKFVTALNIPSLPVCADDT